MSSKEPSYALCSRISADPFEVSASTLRTESSRDVGKVRLRGLFSDIAETENLLRTEGLDTRLTLESSILGSRGVSLDH